jgi:mono/diheme cytochrome c family protein
VRLRPAVARCAAALLATGAVAGCARGCTSSRPPIHVNPNMDYQEKYQPLEESRFFYDGSAMRLPVPGTVARGQLHEDGPWHTGRDVSGAFVAAMPVEPTQALAARGRERYAIYCQPCHAKSGDGKGILFERGGVPTPSYHEPRIREMADGEMFDVITNGKGLMKPYRYPVPAQDRWAIIAHVRSLQRERAERDLARAASREEVAR